jgi:ABC-2 type transport system ATP-binding protein
METPAIQTAKLGRTYKLSRKQRQPKGAEAAPTQRVALDAVDLEIRPGELFGLLGPNGAGKTTLIKILATLLAPTSGSAWVDGLNVVDHAAAIRPRINMVSGGESCGYGLLTVRENLWLFAQIYGVPTREAQKRIDAMLAVVGLSDRAHTKISHLSTGLRQKMNFCRGFITDPRILFLDEPTLGLDVTAARAIRQFVRSWIKDHPQRTILLTTHYMMEADELCDRVAIIDGGKVLVCDTPAALKQRVQRYPLFTLNLAPNGDGWKDVGKLPGVQQCTSTAGHTSVELKVTLQEESAVGTVLQKILGGGAHILSLKRVDPTLEDVFIQLVGHGLGDDAETEARTEAGTEPS